MADGFYLMNAGTHLPVGPLMDNTGNIITNSADLAGATMSDLFTNNGSGGFTVIDQSATYQGQHTGGDNGNGDGSDGAHQQEYYIPVETQITGEDVVTEIKTFFDPADNTLTPLEPASITMGGNLTINYGNSALNGVTVNALATDTNGEVWSADLLLENTGARSIYGKLESAAGTTFDNASLPLTIELTNKADGSGMGNISVTGTSWGKEDDIGNWTNDDSDAVFTTSVSAPDGIETLKGDVGSAGDDVFIGGLGSYTADGGDGFDMFVTSTAQLETNTDVDGNVINQNGVIIDLSASSVTYLGSRSADTVVDTEYFIGTQGDDIFVGAGRYESLYNIQAFNPAGGNDEIFGAVDALNPFTGDLIEIHTTLDYSSMEGGQGVVFILAEADANAPINFTQFSDQIDWLPSGEGIIDSEGNISSTSNYNTDKTGGTVILDSYGDKDLAFDIDHYIGSSEADVFLGASEDDIFDAGMGELNYMSGGLGEDELIISDKQYSDEDIDQSTIKINRIETSSQDTGVGLTPGGQGEYQLVDNNFSLDPLTVVGDYYKIDFADIADASDVSAFLGNMLALDKYEVTSDYSLYVVSQSDLSLNTDYSVSSESLVIASDELFQLQTTILDHNSTFVLREETEKEGDFIISGLTDAGNDYSTVIENVEKVTLTSNDVEYIGNDTLTGSDASYELLIGGQGDLGDMLYVATGEALESTSGGYSLNPNTITGEIYYSGNHEDFDRDANPSQWASNVAAAYTVASIEGAHVWNNETAEFFAWVDSDGEGSAEGFEVAVKYTNGDINSWSIDNRHFDTFQNVQIDQALADAINLQFGGNLDTKIGSYRVLYEAAYADIENIISSSSNVESWNFDAVPESTRSTFYIQVGGNATGENGNGDALDTKLTNVKVERISDENDGFKWSINPEAEILVNMREVPGSTQGDDVMISGSAAETIEAGIGSDIMMGRGGSDNYKINKGDTIQVDVNGEELLGDYGVAGDVINEIGGSSDDKSDAITLASATDINQLTFTRTEIRNEDWTNTLKIDVDYEQDGVIDDTMYVFDHYNQNLGFRAVEKLYLDDGWDTDEIWNLVTGETSGSTETYTGTGAQDILMAGMYESILAGGDGKDILIGENFENHSSQTTFVMGTDEGWDKIADIIQNFGNGDSIDLKNLGITADDVSIDENRLLVNAEVVAEISSFNNGLTMEDILDETNSHLIYG